MSSKIIKGTSKGQITLPMEWRKKFNTDTYVLSFDSKRVVIKPIDLKALEDEEVLFDAVRDNGGKGVPVDEMIKLLNKDGSEWVVTGKYSC